MRRLWIAALLTSVSIPAFALEQPPAGPVDPNVRNATCAPNDRVKIVMTVGRVTNIDIGHDRLAHLLLGDENGPVSRPDPTQTGLQKVPLMNDIPLTGARTGTVDAEIIAKTPEDTDTAYLFLLEVRDPPRSGEDPDATYNLICQRSATVEKQQIQQQSASERFAAAKAKKAQEEKDKLVARLAAEPFYGKRNWDYDAIGDGSITPVRNGVSDNGMQTVFRYPGNMQKPAIFIADGGSWCDIHHPPPSSFLQSSEHTARSYVKDDYIVVQETAAHFRIRMGEGPTQRVADISNCSYNPIGQNPGTGTSSPDGIRAITQK
jgi:type IV secretion system protein VirB9